MGSDATQAVAAPPVFQLPQELQHAKKASLDEQFEHRWRKAYEVRALERESRQATSQPGSRRGSMDLTTSTAAATIVAASGAPAADKAATRPPPSKLSAASGCAVELTATAAAGAGDTQHRPREVVDDDEEEESGPPRSGTGPATAAGTSAARASHTSSTQLPGQGGVQGKEDEPELECRLVWDSSSHRPGREVLPSGAGAGAQAGPAVELKERGNALLKAGELEAAVACYTAALAACGVTGKAGARRAEPPSPLQAKEQGAAGGGGGTAPSTPEGASGLAVEGGVAGAGTPPAPAAGVGQAGHQLLATLHSNRAHALLKLKRNLEAAADALQAHRLHPRWTKPLYRLAQAKLELGQWAQAVAACRKGEQLAAKDSEGHTEFTPLLDRVAVHAARAGSLAGYTGLQLEVRSAGKEAWLGRGAPHVLELDGPEDEDSTAPTTTLPQLPPTGATAGAGVLAASGGTPAAVGASADPLVSWDYRQTAAVQQRRRTSFRSVKEAVAAARDGDRIILRRGTHNGMGECVPVSKRVLIEGEGQLGEATIDQRANVPMFRITRGGVVLRNIDLDQTGFREALLVDGPSTVHPLIQGCSVKCSGDDAVNTGGAAVPTFLRCVITSKKCGLKAYGSSAPRLEQCSLEKCGEQGVRAMEETAPVLHGCTISECEEEAVVAMGSCRLVLHRCALRECKGPGVDVSGAATASITACTVEQCVGGVWAWDEARVAMRGVSVAGGPSHALLVDSDARVEVRESVVKGTVHATEAAWAGILHPSNSLADPDQPTDFPPEDGPFRFIPNRYTRKQ